MQDTILLQSYLAKSGFPVDELNKLRAAVRKERRKLFEARMGETVKNLAAEKSCYVRDWKIFAKRRCF